MTNAEKAAEELIPVPENVAFGDVIRKAFLKGVTWARENPEWISVTERLPKIGERCLIAVNFVGEPPVLLAERYPDRPNVYFHAERAIWCGLESVKFWLPLPPAPKEEK